MEREAFVNIVTADRLDAPGYFAYDSVLNSKKRQILDPNLSNTLRVGVPSLGRRQYHRGDGGDIKNSADFVGGLAAWEAAQLPIVSNQSAPK